MEHNSFFFLIILFVFITLTSCDEPETGIVIENKTGFPIYCITSTVYPNTSLKTVNETALKREAISLYQPNDKRKYGNISYCDKTIFNNYVNNDILIVFAFLKSDIDTAKWYNVVAQKRYYRRYFLKHSDLQSNSCTVIIK